MKILKILFLFISLTLVSCTSHKVDREKLMQARKYADKATVDIMKGDFEQARAGFNLALEIAKVPEAYDGLGCIAFYKKDYKLAEEYFIKAYDEDKEYLRALANLALLYDVLGLKEEANNIYEFLIEKNPKDYRFRNNFAGLLYDNNNKSKAKEELRKAMALKKDDIIVNNMKKVGVKNANATKNVSTAKSQKTINVGDTNNVDKKSATLVNNDIKLQNANDAKNGENNVKNASNSEKVENKKEKKAENVNKINIDSFKF